MASEHDFDGVMSEQEQENHLAKLVLEERKAQKKLACLTSKARQTADILHVVMALWLRWNAMIGQHSKAGAAAQGVPNLAAVPKPLHRSR